MTWRLFIDDKRDPPKDGRKWIIACDTKSFKSLFVQKYRAHKSKICPMVEYKE